MARDVIRHHHERWDGTGYPDGLVGKATPIGARIAGVADSFAAMISARPHRLPRRPPAAFDEISRLAGKEYDPTVVNALERVLEGADWRGVRFGLRHHILIIDLDEPRGVALAVKLCSHGYLAEAIDLETARDRFEHSKLSGIIISADIGDGEIRQLISEVRESARLSMLPVVVTDAAGASRVSLLEAGADVCLAAGSSFEELRATLGAFLRREDKAALNTRKRGEPPPWSGLQGDVQDFPLSWLLQMLNYDGRTAALFIDSEDGDEGVIYLQGGQPRHAQTKTLVGDDALRVMLTWERGTFRIGPEVKTEKQTIELPLMKLLLDQATRDDHAAFFGAVQV
jgi:DNA-binding response OmpR family regulator